MYHYVSFERQSETKRKQAPQSEAHVRLATSRPLGERSEPSLAAKQPTASDEVTRGHKKSDEGLLESLC